MKKHLLFFIIFLLFSFANKSYSQNKEFSFLEYIAFVKKYHPLVKIANLQITEAESKLLIARGAFDPKLESYLEQKDFNKKDYYSVFNGTLKIPTWYGVELKASLDKNEGLYLNPENNVPETGLLSAGIGINLNSIIIDDRRAALKQAKIGLSLSKNTQLIEANKVLYNATIAYLNWKKAYEEFETYKEIYTLAKNRELGIKKLIQLEENAAIDGVEAQSNTIKRQLSYENAQVKLLKAKLELSIFLWINNNVPIELENQIVPEKSISSSIETVLKINENLENNVNLQNHPKVNALIRKREQLEIEQKLIKSKFIPNFYVNYNFLSEQQDNLLITHQNNKINFTFSYPLFLRKERGYAKLNQQKIDAQNLEIEFEKINIKNNIIIKQKEIEVLKNQQANFIQMLENNKRLLQAEETLFSVGESSLFLIITRENNLLNTNLEFINFQYQLNKSYAELFKYLSPQIN